MIRHLTAMELDQVMEWKGNKAPKEMFALLAAQRAEKDIQPVGLPAIRKVLRGETHLRGRSETRGRKRRVTARGIEALDNARKRLQRMSRILTVPVRYPCGTRTVPVRYPV